MTAKTLDKKDNEDLYNGCIYKVPKPTDHLKQNKTKNPREA